MFNFSSKKQLFVPLIIILTLVFSTLLFGCALDSGDEPEFDKDKVYQEGYDKGYEEACNEYQNQSEAIADTNEFWLGILGNFVLDSENHIIHDTLGACVNDIKRENLKFTDIDDYDSMIKEISDNDGYFDEYLFCPECIEREGIDPKYFFGNKVIVPPTPIDPDPSEPVNQDLNLSETEKTDSNSSASEEHYIGNKNTKKFHYEWCKSVDAMKDKNKVELTSREEAINRGFDPCQNCKP